MRARRPELRDFVCHEFFGDVRPLFGEHHFVRDGDLAPVPWVKRDQLAHAPRVGVEHARESAAGHDHRTSKHGPAAEPSIVRGRAFQPPRLELAIDEDLRSFLFRSVRECLINAIKHAQAKSVRVSMVSSGQEARILIEDDGVGMNLDETRSRSGFGLFSIQERLQVLGGSLKIDSARGSGTRVFIRVPVHNDDEVES